MAYNAPRFLTLLDEQSASRDENSWLPIPPLFTQRYAARFTAKSRIKGPDGVEWSVRVGGQTITSIGMRRGWKDFLTAYNLKAGDNLLVKLVGDSVFKARAFNPKTGLEKFELQEPEFGTPGRATRSRNRVVETRLITDTTPELQTPAPATGKRGKGPPKTTSKEPKSTQKKSLVSSTPVEKTPQGPHFVTSRREVSEAERERALEAAKAFKSRHPISVKLMKGSHVYNGFWMGVEKEFSRGYLPDTNTEMILRGPDGKEWPAKWLGEKSGISGGWRKFSLDHGLEDGDVCVFELVDPNEKKPVIQVHIHRVVELEAGKTRLQKVNPKSSTKSSSSDALVLLPPTKKARKV